MWACPGFPGTRENLVVTKIVLECQGLGLRLPEELEVSSIARGLVGQAEKALAFLSQLQKLLVIEITSDWNC